MVVSEKVLINRMKEAYKTYGYTVAVHEDRMYLSNGFWLVEIDVDNVPGEIMAMFGGHIRKIPVDGDAYKVIRDKDGPIVQTRMMEDALMGVEELNREREAAFDHAEPVIMRRTNLTYDGCRIWQANPGMEIYLIDPRYAALIAGNCQVYRVGNGIYAEGEISRVWVLRVNNQEAKAYLEHLEKKLWVTE